MGLCRNGWLPTRDPPWFDQPSMNVKAPEKFRIAANPEGVGH